MDLRGYRLFHCTVRGPMGEISLPEDIETRLLGDSNTQNEVYCKTLIIRVALFSRKKANTLDI